MTKYRKSTNSPAYQILEPRKLLAGNVTVSVDGSALTVLGDFDDNQILIVGSQDGSATISGLDGTTINGGTAAFVAGANLQTAQIQTGEGNDEVDIRGLVLGDALILRTDGGDDTTDLQHLNVDGIEVTGDDGNDVLEFDNVFSRGSIVIQGGDGDDTVAIGAMASVGNGLIDTGSGNDLLAVDNLGIKENLILQFGDGDDQALIAGETYAYRGDIELGEGNDNLSILPATNDAAARFRRDLRISGDSGDDTIAFDSSVDAQRRSRIDGGVGNDAIQEDGADLERTSISNFESEAITDLNGQLDAFYASLAASNIDVTRFGGTAFDGALVLTVSDTVLTFNEGDLPAFVDADLQLTGNSETEIAMVTISLTGFQDGADQFAFADTDTITSVFDLSDDENVATLILSGEATVAQYEAALQSVTFQNTSDITAASTRTVEFTVTTNEGDLTGSRTINVESTNAAPVLATQSSAVVANVAAVDESGSVLPVSISSPTDPLVITDADSLELSQAIVAIDEGRIDGDVLAFTDQAGITGGFDEATGVLTLSGDASVSDYQDAINGITFGVSDVANIGQRTVTIEVTDVSGNTATTATGQADIRIDVVTPATARVTTSANDQEFATGESRSTVDPSILVVGNDDTVITGATVQLSEGYQEGEDELTFVRIFSNPEISGSFNAATGTLTLTGDASAEVYQSALRNVVYDNTINTVSDRTEVDREVIFTINSDTAITDSRVVRQGNFSRSVRDQALLAQYEEDNNLTAQVTDSGLHFIVEEFGNDVFPSATDSVRVNYTGTLLDGSEFDANDDFTFALTRVIAGWTEGFQFFSEGSSGQILIPSDLAYGETALDGIPTTAVLVFDIELFEVNPDDSGFSF